MLTALLCLALENWPLFLTEATGCCSASSRRSAGCSESQAT